jgi:hypothetical protein
MRYLLMVAGERAPEPGEMDGCGGWSEEMETRGIVRGGGGLRPPAAAVTVRVRNGEVLLSDGPFAETKEQIGGFSVIDCADLDEAIEVASKHPAAAFGMIELRPIQET